MSRQAPGAAQYRVEQQLIGARKLLEIVDSPPTEPVDDDKPA